MHFYSGKLKKLIVLLMMSSMVLTNANLTYADEIGDELILDEYIEEDNVDITESEMADDSIADADMTDEPCDEEIEETKEKVIDENDNYEVVYEEVIVEDVTGLEELSESCEEDVMEFEDEEILESYDESGVESKDDEIFESCEEDDIESGADEVLEYYDENEGYIVEEDEIAEEDGRITVPQAGEGFDGKSYYEWAQRMSKDSNMRSSGCRICSFSKMLYEAGFKDDMDPDKYFTWGKNNGYFKTTCGELTTFGQSAVGYAKQKGASASIVKKVDISGYSADNANTVMNLLKSGYYVVLWSGSHAVYVGREASLNVGYPIIYDSSFGSSSKWMGKYGTIIKWKDYTAYQFTHITAFSINNSAKEKIYSVDYVLNGGINDSRNFSTYRDGESLHFYAPTRNGYKFDGWYKESSFINKITSTPTSGNVTVYAKWIVDNPCIELVYFMHDGTNSPNNPTKLYERAGRFKLSNPTRSGYAFGGWFFDANYTKPVGENGISYSDYKSQSFVVLHARWVRDKTYQYDGNVYKLSQAERIDVSPDGNAILFYFDAYYYPTGTTGAILSENSLCIVRGTFCGNVAEIEALNIIYDCNVVNDGINLVRLGRGVTMIGYSNGKTFHNYMAPMCLNVVLGDEFSSSNITDFKKFFGLVCYTEYIDFSRVDTSSAVSMEGMFGSYTGCGGPYYIKEFDLSSFNTARVKNMSYMFFYRETLEKVNLSSFNTSQVTDMSWMFYGCRNVKEVNLSSFDMSNVTNVESMLGAMDSLETLYTPKKTRGIVPELPFVMYDEKGNEYHTLPAYSDKSIKLTKGMPSFKVSFNTNGGSTIAPYEKVIISSKIDRPADPSKNGYKFVGWYKDSTYTQAWDFDNDTVTKDTTLYAKWVEIASVAGWNEIDGRWLYKYDDGSYAKDGWAKIGGIWYHFDQFGYMQTGWIKDGGSWYYLKSSGAMAIGWIKEGGNWYYLKSSGAMAIGWIKEGGNWYYLKSSGAMAVGWIKDNNKWYYLKSSGAMAVGWIKLGDKEYYLYSDGHMAANEWIGKYHVNANGVWDKTR